MVSSWPYSRLEAVTVNHDSKRKPVKKLDRKSGPYPYYGASGIADYVDGYLFDGEYLLISEDGENLKTQNTPIAFMATGKFWVNNHAHIVTGNDKAITKYLCYCFQATDIHKYLSGTTRPKLTKGDLNRIELPLPPLPEQKAIAHILGTLDDKIELNRKMNRTLEEMARALFKSWFVDFDPVKKKMNGEPTGLPAEIDRLFPSEMADSAMGKIPKGWRVGKLGDVIDIKHGYAFKGQYFVDEPNHNLLLTPGNFRIGGGFKADKFKYYDGEIPPDYVLGANDLIVTMTDLSKQGDTLGYPAFVPNDAKNTYLHNQRLGRVIPTSKRLHRYYLYELLRTHGYRAHVLGSVSGSTVKHTSPGRILDYSFARPGEELLDKYEALIEPVQMQIGQNEGANKTLARLRDTILPRLISGQLRVKDAEKFVERRSV